MSSKYILSNGPKALIASSGKSIIVDQRDMSQLVCPFKLPDKDVVPCDYDGLGHMLVYIHHNDFTPCIKVFKMNATVGETPPGSFADCVYQNDLAKAKLVTQIKFWNPDRIAYVTGGRTVIVEKYEVPETLFSVKRHKVDIIAVGTNNPDKLLTLSRDAVLLIWNNKGETISVLDVGPAKFSLGFPYIISSCDGFIAFTADQGVYTLNNCDELDI